MKFSIKGFFNKCEQIHSFLRIWPHLLNKSFMENFILLAVILPVRAWGDQNLKTAIGKTSTFLSELHTMRKVRC